MEENFKYHKWAMFVNEAALFSDTFREEMASQLQDSFYSMLGVENDIKRPKFRLHAGLQPLKTIYKDGYGFALVYIINPIALSTPVTAYWKPLNEVKAENAAEIDIWKNDNIEFGWCTDFNNEDYTLYLKPRNIYSRKETNAKFEIEYDYTLYPDLSFTICCSEKIFEDEINEIEKILSATIKDTYISELTNQEDKKESDDDNEVVGILDFQDNDFEVSKHQLFEAFQKIGQSKVGQKIERVIIE